MADMINALMIELKDVLIGQGVENVFSFFACCDDPQGAQVGEMVRNRRLAHAQHQAEIAHTQFSLRQQPDNAYTGGVRERLEQCGGVRGGNAVE